VIGFLHRGIAARQFQRAFVLAEGIEVMGASISNGLLHVELTRPIPEPRVRTIPISDENEAKPGVTLTQKTGQKGEPI
jgi:HSP20 family molecular chaperone IbpA